MNVRATFGANLKRFREAAGLTQSQLGEKLGVTWQTVSNYETGMRWPREPEMVAAMSKVLRVRPWQLLAEEGDGGAVPPDVVDLAAQLARACGLKVNGRS